MRQIKRFAAIVLLSGLSLASHAGTFRAYLSINGNDANPCSLGQPCRLTDAALAAVNDGGEIWIMDSGNFNLGTLNVTKSVSIIAGPGAIASIFAINGPAINIATANVKVALRNLVIKALAGFNSNFGIRVSNGASLLIENCTIAGMQSDGIFVSAPIQLHISETTVRDSLQSGIYLDGGVTATMSRVTVIGNNFGIYASGGQGTVTLAVRDSVVADSATTGITATTAIQPNTVQVAIGNSQITGNGTGFFADGLNGALVRATLTGNLIANNTDDGVGAYGSGYILMSDNTVSGNATGVHNNGGTITTTSSNTVFLNTFTNSTGTIGTIGKF